MQKEELLYKETTFKIIGAVFTVQNTLGPGLKETSYQKAIALEFRKQNISFRQLVQIPLYYDTVRIGTKILDFIIEEKVILELKSGDYFRRENISQLINYLQVTKLSLGILMNFTQSGVKWKRILSPELLKT